VKQLGASPKRVLAALLGVFPTTEGVSPAVRHNARLVTSWLRSPDGMSLPSNCVKRIICGTLSGEDVAAQLEEWLRSKAPADELILFISGRIGPLARPLLRTMVGSSDRFSCFYIVDCGDGDQFISEFTRLEASDGHSRPSGLLAAASDTAGRPVLQDSQSFAAVLLGALRTGDSTQPTQVGLRGIHDRMVRQLEMRGGSGDAPRLLGHPEGILDQPMFPNPTGTDKPPAVDLLHLPMSSQQIEPDPVVAHVPAPPQQDRTGYVIAALLVPVLAVLLGVALSPWRTGPQGSVQTVGIDGASCRARGDCIRRSEPPITYGRAGLEASSEGVRPVASTELHPVRAPAPDVAPKDRERL
jgi:hypothetical protein